MTSNLDQHPPQHQHQHFDPGCNKYDLSRPDRCVVRPSSATGWVLPGRDPRLAIAVEATGLGTLPLLPWLQMVPVPWRTRAKRALPMHRPPPRQ